MAEVYNHKVVEKKWQKVWDDEKAFARRTERAVFPAAVGPVKIIKGCFI